MTKTPEQWREQEGRAGEGSVVKQEINEALAPTMDGRKVLDAFAGTGLATNTFGKYADEVVAIELDEDNFEMLEDEFDDQSNIKLYEGNNINWMEKFLKWGEEDTFDVVDLDPFQNFYKQLPLALRLLNNDEGLLFLTTGEAFGAFRERFKAHSERGQLYGLTKEELQREWYADINSSFWKFPYEVVWQRFAEPRLEKEFGEDGFELVHYTIHPRVARFVIKVGDYDIPDDVTRHFNPTREHSDGDQFPKHVGWHQDYTKTNTKDIDEWFN